MARTKPDPYIVADLAQCKSTLAEMAALDRQLSALETEMRESIDAAKARASRLAEPLAARRKELENAVAVYGKLNRQELFSKANSLDLGFGVIGFRTGNPSIVQIRGITAEMTLEKLHQYNLTEGIRIKEEINKETALGWSDERLELVGLKRQQRETFFVDIRQDDIPRE